MIQFKIKTEYTFGETYASIDNTIECLKAQGCKAAGIVDLNSTWGHVPWFKACKAADIKPLLGVDLVVSDDDTTKRMWFLAKNKKGLTELYQLSSKAHIQPATTRFGKVARLYTKDVKNMSNNIMKFAGDITDKKFLLSVKAIIDINPSSLILALKKKKLAKATGLKIISTSDNAYAFEKDKQAFEFMGSARTKMTPQHILNKLDYQKEAEKLLVEFKDYKLPTAPMIRAEGDLEALCREGIKYRKMKWTKVYEERLMYELELIRSKDYESYFIVVADMVHYAKRHMLVGPSRGSAAGSLVCYLSRITEIDPIPPGLYFERFIDITRTDLPDIDLDFPDNKREMVFEYMADKYGANNTAHIGTVSRFKPRSALIQVCKALNISSSATGAIKVAMVERSSADARASDCLLDTFKTTTAGKEFIKRYPEAVIAAELEGHVKHTGVHAAGLLICNDDITKYCTVDGNGIAHVDKGSSETLGLLKIDVLGLRTLSILEDSGIDIDWYNLPFDDPKTYDIFNSGKLCGVFQYGGDAMKSVSKQISVNHTVKNFKNINDIDAVTALARPGPLSGGVTIKYMNRKNGEPYKHIHKLVAKYMKDTFGLPIYQEQTLAIVREIGKFDWEAVAIVRKGISKSVGLEFFKKFLKPFIKGAASHGIPKSAAIETWELINAMGSWQMNKAHTFSYAVISYWCAYLKANHLLEFAAANLRNAKDEDSAIDLLRELAREGVEYIPLDIKKSLANWSVQGGKLYGGFISLKGIGEAKAKKLIEARNSPVGLSAEVIEKIKKAENPFNEIFPFHNRYANIYKSPAEHGVASKKIIDIADIEDGIAHGHERVFLGEMIYKSPRNANEEADIKKRDGKIATGPTDYLNIRLRDDSDVIGGRIGRYDYKKIGVSLLEDVPVGAHLLIRAKFYNGIRYAFVKKWRRVD
jgi:DNA polymerase III alpha subunit